MEMEHSFTVPVPEERAWEVLLDVERVAPCMPGATLDSVDGDKISGRIKVKVGPIAMTYAGTASSPSGTRNAHVIVLEASGKETRGAGTASAKVRSTLQGQDGQTHVIVNTTLNVTGKPAQFGRGVMTEVGGKLIGIFASNLADMLSADQQPASEGSGDEQEGDLGQPIEELGLSLRSYNSLRREGVHTVGGLSSRTRQDLLAIDNIGPASVEEIKQKLADRGLTLADSPASSNGLPGAPPLKPAAAAATASPPPAPGAPAPTAPRPASSTRPSDDDAIDLLGVAGLPVLKRAIPVAAAALAAAAVIALRIRSKHKRAGG